MGTFVPGTKEEQQALLEASGYTSFDDLFSVIPASVYLKKPLPLEEGLSEMETDETIRALAAKNRVYRSIFRGAGSYDHYIPAIVKRVVSKETFLTAYTPYQAEISQGILQSIFEYQSMICALTGLDVSNASVYDGATATAEAAELSVERKKTRVLISETVSPEVRKVVMTYAFGRDTDIQVIPEKDGRTDTETLKQMVGPETACVIIQQPNYYGLLEEAEKIGEIAHSVNAKYIMNCNPISLGLLKTPAEVGADLAVGEGQPLGMPIGFGGPYLGFMAATQALMRKLPGRIVGETTDSEGRRAYVLTLQAREQHIKREKASSNICSNEALCALTAAVYLSAMGPEGMREVALSCMSKAHYLAEGLKKAGFALAFEGEFFHEFVTEGKFSQALLQKLDEKGILGGLPLGENRILWCCTEKNTREMMDEVIRAAEEVAR